ncbi:MAG: TonB-dependent receptor plug domain-containing protein, partial [Kiritimatiellae bacterium]|nr:TonB-dependent receptor plug domain-containing protein [Kiritimatiellia bacterium]
MTRKTMGVVSAVLMGIEATVSADHVDTNATIVVTARRELREVAEIPAHVTVLTAEDVQVSSAKTVADLLAAQSGICIRSITGSPATTDVSIRGFGENAHGRVLVLMDGRPVNRPDMATINWLQFPLSAVERVEIVRGSASSLYGDRAVGGVINIITRRGAAAPTELSLELGSFGFDAERFSASVSGTGVGLSVRGERLQTDGYRDRSGFLSQGLGLGLTWNASEELSGSLGLSWQRVEYEMPGALTREEMQANPRMAKNPADEAVEHYLTADADVRFEPSEDHRFELKLTGGRNDIESDTVSFGIFSNIRFERMGIYPTYAWRGELWGRDNRLMLGFDHGWDGLDYRRYSDQSRQGQAAQADLEKQIVAGHVRDEYELGRSVTLELAGRIERAEFEATINPVSYTHL